MVKRLGQLYLPIFRRLPFGDLLIVIFFVICLIHPLTLPNYLNTGFNEIDVTAIYKCNFLKQQGDIVDGVDIDEYIGPGGRYENKHCNSKQHVAIIVPYRNRSEHLKRFIQEMHPFLVAQNAVNYQIFVIEQDDQLPFNRGNLLNIGFHEAFQYYPQVNCLIFHDVDILPSNLRQLYTCSHTPRHLCAYLDKFRYVLIYPQIFGGVVAMRSDQFLQVNGYSNGYSGWGGEDDDLYSRVKHKFGLIERYPKDIGRCIMLTHHQNDVLDESRKELLKDAVNRFQADGLSDLNRTYVRKSINFTSKYVKISVSLR